MRRTTPKPNVLTPDTIAAIATAPGRGGVGVIRLSGSNLLPFAFSLTGKTPKPRYAALADFHSASGETIDTGLLLHFPAPHSFTGEDVLELQGHGGPVVLQMLLSRCLDLGARLAQPGEFSQRAFLNGKLDLAQAEAIADLIEAGTNAAARSAIRSLQGEFSRLIDTLQHELTQLRMLVEATLDFPDEEIDFLQASDAFGRLRRLQDRLVEITQKANQGKLLQSGLQVVLAGQPNVGKSSLLNRLAGDDLAIVTPIAGTTRDALKSTIQIQGIPLHIIDTAGLRDTNDTVEKIGIERSWKEIAKADLVLLLVDAQHGISAVDEAILEKIPAAVPRITVWNKIDLYPPSGTQEQQTPNEDRVFVSAKTGRGMDGLEEVLLKKAGWQQTEDVFTARERHLRALQLASEHLNIAFSHVQAAEYFALELFAEELRLCQRALGEITGEFTPDDLLGVIFGEFCIGK